MRSTQQASLLDEVAAHGPHDLVFEATGYSPIVVDAMCQTLAKYGVLILSSATGGMRRYEVPSDAINLDFVLGNKLMFGAVTAGRQHFEEVVRDIAVADAQYPYHDWPPGYTHTPSKARTTMTRPGRTSPPAP